MASDYSQFRTPRRGEEHTTSIEQDLPIGHGTMAKNILKGIKQWAPDVIAAPADAADALYYAARQIAQGQKRRSVPSLGWGEKVRGALARSTPRSQAELSPIQDTSAAEEITRAINPLFLSPRNLSPLTTLAALSGAPGTSLSIVKPRGGNWMSGPGSEMENALNYLKKGSQDNFRTLVSKGMMTPEAAQSRPEYALNQWIEGPLTRYIKRDLATEGDPIRKLLEQDRSISHLPLQQILQSNVGWVPSKAIRHRKTEGYPEVGMGQGQYGKAWENLADAMVGSQSARDTQRYYSQELNHPMAAEWVKNLPPESKIYDFAGDEAPEWLGLSHLTDELWNAARPDSDLPAHLRLTPEQFKQMGIEKAVRHVADINAHRMGQKAESAKEMLSGPGVIPVREYAENNPKGLRWVEIGDTDPEHPNEAVYDALKKQLKYEGDTMGHCVGGYCEDVIGGQSRIFSLRDAKGEPHVTVEVQPGGEGTGHTLMQIKGKQNRAPNDEYLPFVQDFVKNSPIGSWGEVYDLPNAQLYGPGHLPIGEQQLLPPELQFMTLDEVKDFRNKHGLPWTPLDNEPELGLDFAQGGLVNFDDLDAFLGRQ